jgi:hypothetical protein
MADHTIPDAATEHEEEIEAHVHADGGSGPSEEEAKLADSNTPDPSVAAAEKAANERGAHVKGEGALP